MFPYLKKIFSDFFSSKKLIYEYSIIQKSVMYWSYLFPILQASSRKFLMDEILWTSKSISSRKEWMYWDKV